MTPNKQFLPIKTAELRVSFNELKMDIVDLHEIPEIIPMLAEWHHQQWSYLNPQISLEKRTEEYQKFLSEGLIPSTFVARENDEVVGSAAIVEHDMNTRMEYSPWLASVFVHPSHRNKGVGSTLVSHVISQAKKNNTESLYLFTPDKEDFYKRFGWFTIHREPYKNVQVFVMKVNLS